MGKTFPNYSKIKNKKGNKYTIIVAYIRQIIELNICIHLGNLANLDYLNVEETSGDAETSDASRLLLLEWAHDHQSASRLIERLSVVRDVLVLVRHPSFGERACNQIHRPPVVYHRVTTSNSTPVFLSNPLPTEFKQRHGG